MSSSYPKSVKERAKLYLHCMVEIKERLSLVLAILPSDTNNLFKKEICSLQFRHICELIAIACLAAQGDFKTQRAFREAYSPPEIFNALRTLFPQFFPQPSTITFTPGQGGEPNSHHLELNAKPDAYGERDIVSLWNRAGDDLHRASVKKYLKKTFGSPPTLEPIMRHVRGLQQLLHSHVIPLGQPDSPVLLDVRMADANGDAAAYFLKINQKARTMEVESYTASVVRSL